MSIRIILTKSKQAYSSPMPCPVEGCTQSFYKRCDKYYHLKRTHPNFVYQKHIEESRQVYCELCQKSYKSFNVLRAHKCKFIMSELVVKQELILSKGPQQLCQQLPLPKVDAIVQTNESRSYTGLQNNLYQSTNPHQNFEQAQPSLRDAKFTVNSLVVSNEVYNQEATIISGVVASQELRNESPGKDYQALIPAKRFHNYETSRERSSLTTPVKRACLDLHHNEIQHSDKDLKPGQTSVGKLGNLRFDSQASNRVLDSEQPYSSTKDKLRGLQEEIDSLRQQLAQKDNSIQYLTAFNDFQDMKINDAIQQDALENLQYIISEELTSELNLLDKSFLCFDSTKVNAQAVKQGLIGSSHFRVLKVFLGVDKQEQAARKHIEDYENFPMGYHGGVGTVEDSSQVLWNQCIIKQYYKYNLLELKAAIKLSQKQLELIAFCVISTLQEANIVQQFHLNLKPSNLLFDENLMPRLVDWKYVKDHTISGLEFQHSPEEILGFKHLDRGELMERRDAWGLGVILYYLYHDRHPYSIMELETLSISKEKLPLIDIDESIDREMRKIISKLLVQEPGQRWTIRQVFQQQVFQPYRAIPLKAVREQIRAVEIQV